MLTKFRSLCAIAISLIAHPSWGRSMGASSKGEPAKLCLEARENIESLDQSLKTFELADKTLNKFSCHGIEIEDSETKGNVECIRR